MSSRLRKAVLWIASLTAVAILAVGSYGFSPVVDRSLGTEPQANAAEVLPASPKLVDFARDEARAIDAFVVRRSGLTVAQWGEASVPMNLSSVRKAVLSLLYGVAEAKGLVDLDRTLGTIGIDESATPLTDTEKRATIRDLLKARSGVYLPTGAETATMLRTRPARGSVGPGERFFYNNWDFNVLGVAFERETGMTIGKALKEWLAGPIGMRDFHPTHVVWDRWFSPSDHPTYRIHMSARDLALVGQLLLDNGIANGERIVPVAYLRDSLTP